MNELMEKLPAETLLLEKLIAQLRPCGVIEDYLQACESIWLSSWLPQIGHSEPLQLHKITDDITTGDEIADRSASTIERLPAKKSEQISSFTGHSDTSLSSNSPTNNIGEPVKAASPVYAYAQSLAPEGNTIRTTHVRVPGVTALPEAQEISRALRPLKRRAPSSHLLVLDEEETIRQSAESGLLTPIERPQMERWFDVAMVVEEVPSMLVWRPTLREFQRLLERHGSFRDVRSWQLQISGAEARIISASGAQQTPAALIDPSGRRLLFFLTDGVSASVSDGRLARLLARWSLQMPLVVVQMLGEQMWHLTPLGSPAVNVAVKRPGAANAQLTHPRRVSLEGQLALPLVTLAPGHLARWANMLMRTDVDSPAVLLPLSPCVETFAEDDADLAAKDLLENFRLMVSETAYRLAVYLSILPLRLPVMRMVARVMLPESGPEHLAEVLLGGILKDQSPDDARLSEDEMPLDFQDGIRYLLLGELHRNDRDRVIDATSKFVSESTGHRCDLRSLVRDPQGEVNLPTDALPFAELILEHFGVKPRAASGIPTSPVQLGTISPDTIQGALPMPNHKDLQRSLIELLVELEAAVRAKDKLRALELERTILQRLASEAADRATVELRVRELMRKLDQPKSKPTVRSVESFGVVGDIERSDAASASDGMVYPVWFGTNRKPQGNGFTGERHDRITRGRVDVHVPESHQFGSTSTPFWKRILRLQFSDDHLRIQQITKLDRDLFFAEFQRKLDEARKAGEIGDALFFIHGYKITFEEAAIRTAQIGLDLKSPATAFFSWPSRGKLEAYPADEASIEASERAITDFLVEFSAHCGADKIHVIAHSMGNRGFLRALQRIAANAQTRGKVKFGQIFLAAPDVDRDLFLDLARLYAEHAERTTLYASRGDWPVSISDKFHDAPRAGYFTPYTVTPGVDTIAVPDFDVDLLGHSYFAQAEAMLHDIFDLMRSNQNPGQRQRIAPDLHEGTAFWKLRR